MTWELSVLRYLMPPPATTLTLALTLALTVGARVACTSDGSSDSAMDGSHSMIFSRKTRDLGMVGVGEERSFLRINSILMRMHVSQVIQPLQARQRSAAPAGV